MRREVDRQARRAAADAEAYRGGLYARQLGRVLRHFGRDQLLVLQYERCRADPATELARTYAFLGLGAFAPTDPARPVHATKVEKIDLPQGLRRRLVERFRADSEELAELFPGAVDLSLRGLLGWRPTRARSRCGCRPGPPSARSRG